MPNPTAWNSTVRTVANGQPVDAAVTNKPTGDLQRRTAHLKERLDAIIAGQALVLPEQAMASTTLAGTPVYLDDDLIWKPGVAALKSNDAGVPTGLAESAYISGIVVYKDNSTMGAVCLYGHLEFTSEILTVMQGTYAAGPQYLATNAGLITSTRPSIPVGLGIMMGPDANGVYRMFFNPENKSVLEEHVHYRVSLEWRPAGTANCLTGLDPDARYTITDADPTQRGWLEVTDPSFANMVKPAGAKFGYNIDVDPVLSNIWPPIPLSSAYVELADEAVTEDGRLVVNEYNLWWMDNCFGGAPWDDSYPCNQGSSSAVPAADESSSSSSATPIDPCFDPVRRLTLWLVRMIYKTNDATVTNLEAANDTIELVDCNGDSATTGRLLISAKFLTTEESGDTDGTALKSFDSDTLKFTSGIVVARVKSLSSNIVVGGTNAGSGYKSGDVTLDFVDPNSQREGQTSLVSLKNVREASFNDIMFFAFDAGVASHIIGKIDIGQATISATGTLKLYLWLLARAAGQLPAMTLTITKLPMPAGCVAESLPTGAWSSLALGSCSGVQVANDYVQVASVGYSVDPGDILYFKLARSASDLYAGTVGVPSIRYLITV